jgi:hypothetical protein
MYKITYRGTEYTVNTWSELAIIAFNTEKIDMMSWVDSEPLGYTIKKERSLSDAVVELQGLLNDIETESKI